LARGKTESLEETPIGVELKSFFSIARRVFVFLVFEETEASSFLDVSSHPVRYFKPIQSRCEWRYGDSLQQSTSAIRCSWIIFSARVSSLAVKLVPKNAGGRIESSGNKLYYFIPLFFSPFSEKAARKLVSRSRSQLRQAAISEME